MKAPGEIAENINSRYNAGLESIAEEMSEIKVKAVFAENPMYLTPKKCKKIFFKKSSKKPKNYLTLSSIYLIIT